MGTNMTAQLMLKLPSELRQHILRDACALSTTFCVALCSLSSWMRTLALPYLYTTIVVKRYDTSASFLSAISNPSKVNLGYAGFRPSSCVRSLWVTSISNTVVNVFARCDKLFNLALPAENLHWLVHSSIGVQTIPSTNIHGHIISRRLDYRLLVVDTKRPGWSLAHLVDADETKNSPLFNAITHLRIGSIGSYSTHLDLAHFNRLSHIAIPYHRPNVHHLPDLLRVFDFPAIVFLVVVILRDQMSDIDYQAALDWVIKTRTTDHKVYALETRFEDLQKEWEDEARGGPDIWERAERFTHSLSQ